MIGSVSATDDIALALLPPTIVLNVIFDGKNISMENTPRLLRWIPRVGLIRWAFEGLAINEFTGLIFDTGDDGKKEGFFKKKIRRGPPMIRTGEEALETFN